MRSVSPAFAGPINDPAGKAGVLSDVGGVRCVSPAGSWRGFMNKYRVITDKPVATDSPDHIKPFGTAMDNSTCAEFNKKLFALVPNPVGTACRRRGAGAE